MPSQTLIDQVVIWIIQAGLAMLVGLPLLNRLLRLPGQTVRYRRLKDELERPVPVGTPFVIRWDHYRFKKKSYLLFDTAKRGWQYTGQQITDGGWELLFTRPPAGAKLRSHPARAAANGRPRVDYLPAGDVMLGGLPTPDYLRGRPGARAAAAEYLRSSGVDVLDEQTLEAARATYARWDIPYSRGRIVAVLGIAATCAALFLTLIAAIHGTFPGWLAMVWVVSVALAVVGAGFAGYYERRLRNATDVLVSGYKAVARAAERPGGSEQALS